MEETLHHARPLGAGKRAAGRPPLHGSISATIFITANLCICFQSWALVGPWNMDPHFFRGSKAGSSTSIHNPIIIFSMESGLSLNSSLPRQSAVLLGSHPRKSRPADRDRSFSRQGLGWLGKNGANAKNTVVWVRPSKGLNRNVGWFG